MNSKKIRWGVLSTARIGVEKVIPAMQLGTYSEIAAICSRDGAKAKEVADKLNISKYYNSYESMLEDESIDAIYNPLPNHMHYEWTKKSLENGKHVLCEKPFTLNTEELHELIELRDKHQLKVGEAFMVHTHPQWIDTLQRIKNDELGKLRAIQGFFSYYQMNPQNIRNIYEFGGGAIWDIGCYPIHTSRYIFDEEPKKVIALIERDPNFKTDRLASVIMDFPSGQCSFTVSTQSVPHQRMTFFGSEKKLEIEIPFNAPNDRKCKIFIDEGGLFPEKKEIIFDICDQYTIQGDEFSKAILNNTEVPVTLENSLGNTAVIMAIFRSMETGKWETPIL